ncbi:MAG: TM0106 family RecB-like putative nuclease, partial [Polyangiaceae bacterium]|nr:TM0106 family RecB-like putative nuclease [Polyangiaceae bacterium]
VLANAGHQRKELGAWGVTTLADLAALPLPLTRKPAHGSAASLVRVREQARLQLKARTSGLPVYELLPRVKDEGLAGLPAPSGLDVFLDLEGDRLAEEGGLDYLFGYAYRGETGTAQYEAIWALSPAEEKAAFERLMDLVTERRARDATMHVYHYAPYEPTSMKRLMGRYATRADELDALLRSGAFVDLYGIVRKALRAGIDSYSIKKLEPFYGLAREVDLRRVSRQLRAVEYAIAKHDAQSLSADVLDDVRGYNRDDCISAMDLRGWLERLREEAARADGGELGRPATPTAEIKEELKERLERIRVLADALTEHVPDEGRSRAQQAQWLLAQLLEWHRREDKVMYSEFFRLNKMNADELLDARAGLSGLAFLERVSATNRGVAVDRYTFPQQDTLFEDGAEAYRPGGELAKFATVVTIDLEKRTVDLQKPAKVAAVHPDALFVNDIVQNKDAVLALMRLAEDVLRTGLDTTSTHRPERDLLLRNNPRLVGDAPFQVPGEATFNAARRVVLALDGSVLAIQGPPGAGKTHAGAQMIVDLVRNRRSVGVTAGSHKVIRNLLDKVVELARQDGMPLRCMHRVTEKSEIESPHVKEETDSKKGVAKIVAHDFHVVGATAWVWSKEEVAGAVDVLFVDEAGQMSLANVLACAQGARNLVLLGDPQQLEQPQKASHPEGADLSALEYLLEGHETMPADRGLFLEETWRLHPDICRFTSEQFYEGKLRSKPGLERQVITGPTRFAGSGLFYVPVEHEANHNTSPEEAASVADIVAELVAEGVTWTNASGEVAQMRLEDVLIVAPYNAQVSEIAARLTGVRVGTVDKFQGQEAPVVIYSMATSNPEDAPHGMGFLFSRHRLNVATSRARCVCILVGTPRLFEPECRTPEQMRLANAFCAYLQRAGGSGS